MNNYIKTIRFNTREYIILLTLICLILVYPLIDTKFIPGDDGVFQITRILVVSEELKEGIFPVRMYVDNIRFWGSPVGIFYPGLFVLFPALLKCTGVPIEISYNAFIAVVFFSGLLASWYGFFLFTRSKKIAVLSATLYISSGYYLMDAYCRAALGELIALSFMPLALACILRFMSRKKITSNIYVLGILSVSVIIESHVLSIAFLAIFSLMYYIFSIFYYKKNQLLIFKRIIFLALFTFLLNASFIIPFLHYYKEVPISIDFVEDFSQSGWSPLLLLRFFVLWNFWLFIGISAFWIKKLFRHFSGSLYNQKLFLYYATFFVTGFCFLLLSSSLFPWDFLTPLKNLFEVMQFSWRFLGIATLFFCVCGGFGLYLLLQKWQKSTIIVAVLAMLIALSHLMFFYVLAPNPSHTVSAQKLYWEKGWKRGPLPNVSDLDYLYKDMDIKALFAQGNRYISEASISNYRKKNTSISFSYQAVNDSEIILPLVNYPGYQALDQDGNVIQIKENGNHMIVIPLQKGIGSVEVFYKGFRSYKIADGISVLTFVLFVGYIILCFRKKR